MIIVPIWAYFGLASAVLSAVMFLLQDRLKVNGYAMAFWNKATCALFMLPFAIKHGFPKDPVFYEVLAIGAVMYAVSDVVFFSGIGKAGAGAVSRILPLSVIFSFLLWFAVKPALLDRYLANPVDSALILTTLCGSAFFAMRLKKCAVSMRAARAVWFVLFAATVGPILAKIVTAHAPVSEGPYAYVVCEAGMMMVLWMVYLSIRKPVPRAVFFAPSAWGGGIAVGCVSALVVLLNVSAYYHADNPAYVPAVKFLDSVIILAVYGLVGRKSQGDIKSGLGVVLCAVLLILLKSRFK